MKANENNFLTLLKNRKEEGILYVIETYGGLLQSIVRKRLFTYPDKAEECMNDIFLGIWMNIDSFDESKGSFINWSLSNALGLSGDLANYRDIVNTSVTDNGYAITLQEAVATDEKLVINYTIQREDGEPMGEIPLMPDFDHLYINGKSASDCVSGGSEFIDDEHTVIGISRTFDVPGIDMANENTYQLKIDSLYNYDFDTQIKGKWNFTFTADGSDLITDTIMIPIQQKFTIADGVTVVIEEITLNELEQRINYHMEGSTDYLLQIIATDSTGRQAQFDTKIFQGANGIGYMQNQEIIDDGRIDESADIVTMTLYAVEMPKESGRMSDDYLQIGESFEVKLH